MNKKLKLKNISLKRFQNYSNILNWNNFFKHLLIVLVFASILSILLSIKNLSPESGVSIKKFIFEKIRLPQKFYSSFLILLAAFSMFIIIKHSFNKSWLLFIPFIIYLSYIIWIIETMALNINYKFSIKNIVNDKNIFYIITINILFYAFNSFLERKTNPFWVKIQIRRIILNIILIIIIILGKFLINEHVIDHKKFDITDIKTFWISLLLVIFVINLITIKLLNEIMIYKTNQSIWLNNFKITGIMFAVFGAFIIFSLIRVFKLEKTNLNYIFISLIVFISFIGIFLISFGKNELQISNFQILILNVSSLIIWITWFIMTNLSYESISNVNGILISSCGILSLEMIVYIKRLNFSKLQKLIHIASLEYSIAAIIIFSFLNKTGLNQLLKDFNVSSLIEISLIVIQILGFLLSVVQLSFKTRTLSKSMKQYINQTKKIKEVKHV
ncbi:MAG: hypothetical protein GY679_02950 [Mycoplasma sp.]|nr:hypothetical protein [Mycoplasma sp.]